MSMEKDSVSNPEFGKKEDLALEIERLQAELAKRKGDSMETQTFSNGGDILSGQTIEWKASNPQSIKDQITELENKKRQIEEEEQIKLDAIIEKNKLDEETKINQDIAKDMEVNRARIEKEKKDELERVETEAKISALRNSIKEYENTINAVERGDKTAFSKVTVRGKVVSSLSDIHNNIKEAEEELISLEKKKKIKKVEEPVVEKKMEVPEAKNLFVEALLAAQKLEDEKKEKTVEIKSPHDDLGELDEDDSLGSNEGPVLETHEEIDVDSENELARLQMEYDKQLKLHKNGGKSWFGKALSWAKKEPQSLIDAREALNKKKKELNNLEFI
jgi:hypothetical protein